MPIVATPPDKRIHSCVLLYLRSSGTEATLSPPSNNPLRFDRNFRAGDLRSDVEKRFLRTDCGLNPLIANSYAYRRAWSRILCGHVAHGNAPIPRRREDATRDRTDELAR